MAKYVEQFNQNWANCKIDHFQNTPAAREALSELRAQGKLADYSDEELMTNVLATIWGKP